MHMGHKQDAPMACVLAHARPTDPTPLATHSMTQIGTLAQMTACKPSSEQAGKCIRTLATGLIRGPRATLQYNKQPLSHEPTQAGTTPPAHKTAAHLSTTLLMQLQNRNKAQETAAL